MSIAGKVNFQGISSIKKEKPPVNGQLFLAMRPLVGLQYLVVEVTPVNRTPTQGFFGI